MAKIILQEVENPLVKFWMPEEKLALKPKRLRREGSSEREAPWMTDAIRNGIKQRRKWNRMRRNETNEELLDVYFTNWKKQKDEVKEMIEEAMCDYEKKLTERIQHREERIKRYGERITRLRGASLDENDTIQEEERSERKSLAERLSRKIADDEYEVWYGQDRIKKMWEVTDECRASDDDDDMSTKSSQHAPDESRGRPPEEVRGRESKDRVRDIGPVTGDRSVHGRDVRRRTLDDNRRKSRDSTHDFRGDIRSRTPDHDRRPRREDNRDFRGSPFEVRGRNDREYAGDIRRTPAYDRKSRREHSRDFRGSPSEDIRGKKEWDYTEDIRSRSSDHEKRAGRKSRDFRSPFEDIRDREYTSDIRRKTPDHERRARREHSRDFKASLDDFLIKDEWEYTGDVRHRTPDLNTRREHSRDFREGPSEDILPW